MIEKTLDRKLARLAADPDCGEFILADAKDADMAFGVGAAGRSPEMHAGETRFRTIHEYRDMMREIVRQELVDVMLMSASSSEQLALVERIFDHSPVTPAVRANDASDVHAVRGGEYVRQAPRPFRTATIDHIQCGRADCAEGERRGPDLGLYSVTFSNNTDDDLFTLERFKEFRLEAERKGFRYFLEAFNPNLPGAVAGDLEASFLNDMIARCLAGVTRRGRPIFLKIPYNGPKAMEELVAYDRSVIVGILGGSAGTTYDAFKLLAEAKKYGARAALFGRRINQAENQFAFLRFLRLLADGEISPEDAVPAYHAVLARLGVAPHRPLEADMQIRTAVLRYESPRTSVVVASTTEPASASSCGCGGAKGREASTPKGQSKKPDGGTGGSCGCGCRGGGETRPNFGAMTSQERLEYHRRRIAKRLGER